MDNNILDLGQLEGQTPQSLARLLIDLSELLNGRNDNMPSMASLDLLNKILRKKDNVSHMTLEQDALVFSFSAIFQFILWSKIDQPDQLEQIYQALDEHILQSGEEGNEYFKVVMDTFSKTIAASKALADKIATVNNDLNRLQQRSSEESEIIASKMTALNIELNQLQEDSIMDAEAFYRKLGAISNELDRIQEDINRQNVNVAYSRKRLNMASVIVIICLLGLMILIWFVV